MASRHNTPLGQLRRAHDDFVEARRCIAAARRWRDEQPRQYSDEDIRALVAHARDVHRAGRIRRRQARARLHSAA